MTAQIVEIGGQKIAMLPIADYQKLVDLAEDRADVLAAVAAEKRRSDGEEYLPAELVDRILAGESALNIWRKYRGLTLQQLGALIGKGDQAGSGSSLISKLERGSVAGTPTIWRALAEALDVSVDDILPMT